MFIRPRPCPFWPPPCRGVCGVSRSGEGRPSHPAPHSRRRHRIRRRHWSQRHHRLEGKHASSCCPHWLHPPVWLLSCLGVPVCHSAWNSAPILAAPACTHCKPAVSRLGAPGVACHTYPTATLRPLQGIESDEAGSDEAIVKGDTMQFLHFGARCSLLSCPPFAHLHCCLSFWPIRQAWQPPPVPFRIVLSHLAPASGSICCKQLSPSRLGLAGMLVCRACPQSFLSHDACPRFCMTAVPMPSLSPCFRPSGCVQWHRCRQPLWWVAPHRPTRPTKLAKGQSCVSAAQPAQHQAAAGCR